MSTGAADVLEDNTHNLGGGLMESLESRDDYDELNAATARRVMLGDVPVDPHDLEGINRTWKEQSDRFLLANVGDITKYLTEGRGPVEAATLPAESTMGAVQASNVRDYLRSVENSRKAAEAEYASLKLDEQRDALLSRLPRTAIGDARRREFEEQFETVKKARAAFDSSLSAETRSPGAARHIPATVEKLVSAPAYWEKRHELGHGFVFISPDGETDFRRVPAEQALEHYSKPVKEALAPFRDPSLMQEHAGKMYAPISLHHYIRFMRGNYLANRARLIHARMVFGLDPLPKAQETKVELGLPHFGGDMDVEMPTEKRVGARVAAQDAHEIALHIVEGAHPVEGMFDRLQGMLGGLRGRIPFFSDEGEKLSDAVRTMPSQDLVNEVRRLSDRATIKPVKTLFVIGSHADAETAVKMVEAEAVRAKHEEMGKGDVSYRRSTADLDARVADFVNKAVGQDFAKATAVADASTAATKDGKPAPQRKMLVVGDAQIRPFVVGKPAELAAFVVGADNKVEGEFNVDGFGYKVSARVGSQMLEQSARPEHIATMRVLKLTPKAGGPSRTVIIQSVAPGTNGLVFGRKTHVEDHIAAAIPTAAGDVVGAGVGADVAEGRRASVLAINYKLE